ncbi:Hypothetical predicted protein [Lecanosticta acicola]|uniref:Uncharacterized protein n=1 Tax=Lecanosticta acicola TaxID=111012 RepID=A0AAI8YVJ2_9PEZI|nr:Hypothetical predicted protein [Lecanosticta acicola]
MWDEFVEKSKRKSVFFEKEPPQPRRESLEREHLDPLMDEEGTNETRYYRSAEFQQALLEDQIARKLTEPCEPVEQERTGRTSRYLTRRGTMRSSKSSLALFDLEDARARQASEVEIPSPPLPPAYELVVPPSQPTESVAAGSTDSSNSERSSRPRGFSVYLMKGLAPLMSFAARKKNSEATS